MTVGGMGFIPERLLMMMMMITASLPYRATGQIANFNHHTFRHLTDMTIQILTSHPSCMCLPLHAQRTLEGTLEGREGR